MKNSRATPTDSLPKPKRGHESGSKTSAAAWIPALVASLLSTPLAFALCTVDDGMTGPIDSPLDCCSVPRYDAWQAHLGWLDFRMPNTTHGTQGPVESSGAYVPFFGNPPVSGCTAYRVAYRREHPINPAGNTPRQTYLWACVTSLNTSAALAKLTSSNYREVASVTAATYPSPTTGPTGLYDVGTGTGLWCSQWTGDSTQAFVQPSPIGTPGSPEPMGPCGALGHYYLDGFAITEEACIIPGRADERNQEARFPPGATGTRIPNWHVQRSDADWPKLPASCLRRFGCSGAFAGLNFTGY